jgi:hypothetical protein
LVSRIAERFHIDLERFRQVARVTMLNRRVMINYQFIGPDPPQGGDHSYKCPLPGIESALVLLPLVQAFSVNTRNVWVLSFTEINEYRNATGFGGDACQW